MEKNKNELFITHLFDAPRETVFEAWTNPGQLIQWYAPDGCTIGFKSINIKAGGEAHSCIHDPVHGDCWIKSKYHEVEFPARLVFSMILVNEAGEPVNAGAAGKPGDWPQAIVTTVTFEAAGHQTRLTLHQTVAEAAAKKTGAYQSWFKMFDRLQAMIRA